MNLREMQIMWEHVVKENAETAMQDLGWDQAVKDKAMSHKESPMTIVAMIVAGCARKHRGACRQSNSLEQMFYDQDAVARGKELEKVNKGDYRMYDENLRVIGGYHGEKRTLMQAAG